MVTQSTANSQQEEAVCSAKVIYRFIYCDQFPGEKEINHTK